jgi:hypothetical protein
MDLENDTNASHFQIHRWINCGTSNATSNFFFVTFVYKNDVAFKITIKLVIDHY